MQYRLAIFNNIYTDKAATDNHFVASGFMWGDTADIKLDDKSSDNCIAARHSLCLNVYIPGVPDRTGGTTGNSQAVLWKSAAAGSDPTGGTAVTASWATVVIPMQVEFSQVK